MIDIDYLLPTYLKFHFRGKPHAKSHGRGNPKHISKRRILYNVISIRNGVFINSTGMWFRAKTLRKIRNNSRLFHDNVLNRRDYKLSNNIKLIEKVGDISPLFETHIVCDYKVAVDLGIPYETIDPFSGYINSILVSHSNDLSVLVSSEYSGLLNMLTIPSIKKCKNANSYHVSDVPVLTDNKSTIFFHV